MKFKPNIVALMAALALMLTANIKAQTTNQYLSQFPSAERVKSEVKGSDAIDTAARQAAAFFWLTQIAMAVGGSGTGKLISSRDSGLLYSQYIDGMRSITRIYASGGNPTWERLFEGYKYDPQFGDELMKRFFAPDFRAGYYRLSGKQPPSSAAQTTTQLTAPPSTSASSSAKDYATQASTYFKAKDFTKAIELFKKAIELEPTAVRYGNLGLGYFNLKQYPEAIAAFQQGIRLDPNDAVLSRNYGVTLQTAGQYRDALAVFRELQRLKPNDPDNHNLAGNAYVSLEKFAEAVVEFQEAIRLAPTNPVYRKNLGVTYLEMGKKEEALQIYHELQNMDQAKAKEFYAEFQFIESDNPQELLNLGEGSFEVQDYSSARRIFRRVIVLNKNPESVAQAYRMIGRVYKDWENDEKAIESFEQAVVFYQKAVRLNPDKADFHYELGSTYVEMGRKQDALQVYRTLQRLDREKALKLYAEINESK